MKWIASPRFDLGLIFGPAVLAVLLVLMVPAFQQPGLPLLGWLLFVVFIDVAHVYASLYRTYLDPEEFDRRRALYIFVPLACWLCGVILYSMGELLFWRVLAYVAVWHFVRQQFGFVMLYRHRCGEGRGGDAWIDKVAIYATMLYPLIYWHATPGREFNWFMEGDFLLLPAWTKTAGNILYTGALALFLARQVQVFALYKRINWGKIGIVSSTAAVWYVGIIYLNSDFAFTITNVVAHGIPYMALVWLYGRRKWEKSPGWRNWIHRPFAAFFFVGALLGLAYVEEGLWDLFVWQEHAVAFGGLALSSPLSESLLPIIVPFLMLPQVTHYLLDAWIWKFGDQNPGLKDYLFQTPPEKEGSLEETEAIPARIWKT